MAQTALTLVGYAVGTYFGYPQLGAIIGAYVGGVVAAPDVQGPRITDTAAQQSNYGVGIAKTYGTDRISGTVIWTGPLVEHANDQSGKGGPTVTTYSYTRSFAVLLGDGVIGAIRRIWADTKLVYDHRDLTDSAAQMASAAFARYFVFYQGTEAQLPDPTIESIEGAGNVEAYRGRGYVVFTDLPLADFGNRIPQFSFEITPETPVTGSDVAYEPLVVFPWIISGPGEPPIHSVNDTSWTTNVPATGGGTTTVFGTAITLAEAAGFASGDFWSPGAPYADTYVDIYTDSANPIYNVEPGGADAIGDDAQYVDVRIAVEKATLFRIIAPDPHAPEWWQENTAVGVKTWANFGFVASGEAIVYQHPPYSVFGAVPPPISAAYQVAYASGSLGGSMNWVVRGAPVLQIRGTRVPTHLSRTCFPGDPCAASNGLAEMPSDSDWCVSCTGQISPNYEWTIVSGTAKQLCAVEYRAGILYQNARGPVLLPSDPNYGNSAYWAAQAAAAIADGTMQPDVTYPVTVTSYARRSPLTTHEVAAGAADLADIVLDICLLSGLEAGQVDVAQLEGIEVLGYTRGRTTTARSLIEPLRAAFFFDAVESGDVIRFVLRGGAPVAELTIDDLAAGSEQASTDDPVLSDRGQEAELPRVVSVAYKSVAADYQTGTQQARRRIGGTEQQAGTEIPLVLTDEHAAQIAEKLLYDSWIERNKRTITTWHRWTALEPTDIVSVNDGGFTYRLRITDKSEQQGVFTLQASDDDAAGYQSVAAGAPVSGGGKEIRVDAPTRYELLDIPLLRDVDDSASFYVAARGYRSDWRGGRLYRSTDNGISFSAYQDLFRASVMGLASTVLGDYGGGNTIDQLNTVTIALSGDAGELVTITTPALKNNGNPCVLGDEIIQFRTAELVADRTYRLSGLLRGRRGTERYMGTHAVGDRFVLLEPDKLYRPFFEQSFVNTALLYKAASVGTPVGDDSDSFTNTAVAQQPLSPVHLHVARRPQGGFQANWVRRSRYQAPWVASVDAPLGEASEQYRVRVLDGDTELETQTVTEPSAIVGIAVGAGPTLDLVTSYTGSAKAMATVDSPGDVVGVARSGDSPYHWVARRWDSGGAVFQESADLGELIQASHGGGSLYVIGAVYSGAVYSGVTLYRFAYSSLTTAATSRAASDPSLLGFQGVVHDGTDLWVVAQDVAQLQRCNTATLAMVNAYSFAGDQCFGVYSAAGWIWLQTITVGNTRLIRVNPSTGAFVDSIAVWASVGVFGSADRLFVVSETAVRQYDATSSPPTLLQSFTRSSPTLRLTTGAVVGTTLVVGEVGVDVFPGVHFFDMTTGVYLGNTLQSTAALPAGERNGRLLAGSAVTNVSGEWDIGGLETTAISGMTLEVCQLSATAGAGAPATVTIP